MTNADRDIEARIDEAYMRLQTATTERRRRKAWEELLALRGQRSAERVAEMERQQGLSLL